jgi:hypothetical protein
LRQFLLWLGPGGTSLRRHLPGLHPAQKGKFPDNIPAQLHPIVIHSWQNTPQPSHLFHSGSRSGCPNPGLSTQNSKLIWQHFQVYLDDWESTLNLFPNFKPFIEFAHCGIMMNEMNAQIPSSSHLFPFHFHMHNLAE